MTRQTQLNRRRFTRRGRLDGSRYTVLPPLLGSLRELRPEMRDHALRSQWPR